MAGLPFDPIEEARRQWVAHGHAEPDAMAAVTAIMRAQQLVDRAVNRALEPFELTFARYEVLMLLSFTRTGALPITKVGARLMVHPTGITKLVDKLAQQGFVRREPNADDRRGTLAHITPAGRRVATRATKAVEAVRFGADLPAADLDAITGALRALRARAGDLPSRGLR